MKSYFDFVTKIDQEYHTGSLRYGQILMNVLYDTWPSKYKEITNTNLDCFYDDSRVDAVLDKLSKEWIG